ncbi:hypothetical protein C8Q74DRAFT_817045 [Fomes fomentarius]|nr:hypothetical protein C8Q74DRAFT_817045 [Fomes fomentarius]
MSRSCATISPSFSFFPTAATTPHAFNLFAATHSHCYTYHMYEEARQVCVLTTAAWAAGLGLLQERLQFEENPQARAMNNTLPSEWICQSTSGYQPVSGPGDLRRACLCDLSQ